MSPEKQIKRPGVKRGFTQDQHDTLGLELAAMQDGVNEMIKQIGGAYRSNGREVKALERIGKSIEAARVVMDEAEGNRSTNAYYPDGIGAGGYVRWSA